MSDRKHRSQKRRFYLKFVSLVFLTILATYLVLGLVVIIFERLNVVIFKISLGWHPLLTMLVFFSGAVLFGLLITFMLAKIFLHPINELSDAMKKVSKGDFSVEIPTPEEETEMGELIANFNRMVRDLRNVETLKNDFIANVSHEFKTPLATIQGYSTLLQDENLSAEERESYTRYIIEATKQLSALTGNILKLSKLENRDCDVERTRFDGAEQIRQAILFLETQWSIKNIDLDIELDDAELFLNEELLMQVWLNLIGNAIKFSDYAGKIEIKAENDKRNYYVTVRDYGCGMNEQTLSRMFEKFYQGDNSHSKDGNGLGLTLVKKILNISGGEITAESKEGCGTAFYVKLPIAPPVKRVEMKS